MRKETTQWLIPAVLAVAAAIALYFYWMASDRPERPADTAPEKAAAPVEQEVLERPLHPLPVQPDPVDDRPALQPLPPLDQSDAYFKLELVDLFGEPLTAALAESNVIERLVASVDNLPREHIAQRTRPLTGVDGQFLVEELEDSDEYRLKLENYDRYDALVTMLSETDSSELAEAYRRFYPLLQTAYVNLGYPDGYFNDRTVEVIDHLLATPDVPDAPELTRPHVLYEYADEDLEALSSGQKLLIRIGAAHRRAVKEKLREFRALIVRRDEPSPDGIT